MTCDENAVAEAGLGRDEAKVLLYDWWPAGRAVVAEEDKEEVASEACRLVENTEDVEKAAGAGREAGQKDQRPDWTPGGTKLKME